MTFSDHQGHTSPEIEGTTRWGSEPRQEPPDDDGTCQGCGARGVRGEILTQTDGLCPECHEEGPPEDQPSGERSAEPSVTEDDLPF